MRLYVIYGESCLDQHMIFSNPLAAFSDEISALIYALKIENEGRYKTAHIKTLKLDEEEDK